MTIKVGDLFGATQAIARALLLGHLLAACHSQQPLGSGPSRPTELSELARMTY